MNKLFFLTSIFFFSFIMSGCLALENKVQQSNEANTLNVEVDEEAGKLTSVQFYVPSETENKVSIIDVVSSEVVGEIETNETPTIVQFASTMRTAYIANQDSSTIQAINTMTLQPEGEVEVGPLPHGMALSNDNRTLFVATVGDQFLHVVNTQTMEVDSLIDMGGGASTNYPYLAENGLLYVTDHLNNKVYVVDIESAEKINEFTTGDVPRVLQVVDEYLYVAASESGTLEKYDLTSNELVHAIEVGEGITDFVISETGDFAIATSLEGSALFYIDLHNQEVTNVIHDLPGAKHVAFNRIESRVYVTLSSSNEVAVINVETFSVENKIEVGDTPHGITIKALPGMGGSC